VPADGVNSVDSGDEEKALEGGNSADPALAVPVIEGEVLFPGIEAIIKLEAATSDNQWELARLYARETSTKSLRTVADQVGQSHELAVSALQILIPRHRHQLAGIIGRLYRRGIVRGGPGRIGVSAHHPPSVGRGARSSIGGSSRTLCRTWFGRRRLSPWKAGSPAVTWFS